MTNSVKDMQDESIYIIHLQKWIAKMQVILRLQGLTAIEVHDIKAMMTRIQNAHQIVSKVKMGGARKKSKNSKKN